MSTFTYTEKSKFKDGTIDTTPTKIEMHSTANPHGTYANIYGSVFDEIVTIEIGQSQFTCRAKDLIAGILALHPDALKDKDQSAASLFESWEHARSPNNPNK